MLASLARLVKEPEFVNGLIQAPDLDLFFDRLLTGLGGIAARPAQLQQNRVNRIMFREAEHVAKGCGCSAIMVFGDTFVGGIEAERWFGSSEDDPRHAQSRATRARTARASRRSSRCARSPASAWRSSGAPCSSR